MTVNSIGPINKLQFDWVRVATKDYKAYLDLVAALRRKYKHWKPHKWLQYKGQRSSSKVFYGTGTQGTKSHCVVECSGNQAHEFGLWLLKQSDVLAGKWYATRIDLQVTKPHPKGYDSRKAYKRLRGVKKHIESPTGNTLYIGSRTSDTMWRLYDKTEELLRVEIEIKGKQAKRTWSSLIQGLNMGNIWQAYLLRSRVPKVITDRFQVAETAELYDLEEPDNPMQAKLDWLKSLDELVYKLANDHDTGEATATLISRWHEYTTKP